ncbi:MAG: Asp-tRNA(Asn)/Glu-tRNA(Gln) amidotransferase subunit GatA [Victivallaceae bacterium]|nr:Asp-tRNA(Asn)/Glu-tRNA(Gln) amidotransferase subunit GatA [Victivallaceae bacterium]
MANVDFATLGVVSCAEALAQKKYSSRELVSAMLENIRRSDGRIHAFLNVDENAALAAADASDARRAAGAPLSDFDGVPIGVKDNISVEGETLSCAGKILAPVRSPYDATAITRLKSQGFIPFGRLNMDEFAMGSSCENSAFGPTANPLDVGRVPGGSSGGSAAAVAAKFVPAALGSDTGGSIRQPAAFCGAVGLKPTYGRVSRSGLVAFASSLDQIGPLAPCVEDAAAVFDAISGHDPLDCTSLELPGAKTLAAVRAVARTNPLSGMKIGLPGEYFGAGGISSGVAKVMDDAVAALRKLGADVVEVSLPHTEYAVAVYYIVATAEASANLARFDGIRYGDRKKGADLVDTYFKSRGEGFGAEVKRRILLGTYVLSSGYYDAYYLKAQKVRTLIRRDFEEVFRKCDLLLTPVTPDVAFRFGEKSDPLQMYLSDIFTIALNLAGNCGVSIPGGVDAETDLPVGIQLIAPDLAEDRLLAAAAAYEKNVFSFRPAPFGC